MLLGESYEPGLLTITFEFQVNVCAALWKDEVMFYVFAVQFCGHISMDLVFWHVWRTMKLIKLEMIMYHGITNSTIPVLIPFWKNTVLDLGFGG